MKKLKGMWVKNGGKNKKVKENQYKMGIDTV